MNWPHLSTTWAELTFEHCPVDERSGNLSGCLIIRPPAGKAVHLGLTRPIVAADALLGALREIVSQIDQGGSGGKVFARDACIQRARDTIAKAEGRGA